MGWSVPDGELLEFPGGRAGIDFDLTDETGHFAAEVIYDLIHIQIVAFHDELDPAIGKIADVAAHVIS